MSKIVYTINEVIELTGLSRSKIYQEIREGRLKAKKCGRRTLVTSEALQNWSEQLAEFKV